MGSIGFKQPFTSPFAEMRDSGPVLIKEHNKQWSQQFLECPTPLEPSAFSKFPAVRIHAGNINKIYIANCGTLVPSEHSVDGFRKLRTAALLDAARVYPNILVTIPKGLFATSIYLQRA